MAHFAELDENNIVLRVLVVGNDDITDENDVEQEQLGIIFLKNIFGFNTNWKQTSYNGNFRFRYAGIGMTFDEILNAFISSSPHVSWTLNELTADWDPPIPKPSLSEDQITDGFFYEWNEDNYQLDNTTGWVLNQLSVSEE
tara:strand:- start:229 stop:651 length:423 start_codon:yes stop_codon:yes gene_type:complete